MYYTFLNTYSIRNYNEKSYLFMNDNVNND